MNELQFPGLYIDDTANPHAILSFLCQSGYYCLILTDFLAEFGTKCGRVHCDYCDGTLISYRPDTVCVEIPAPCLWMVAFHPDLLRDGYSLHVLTIFVGNFIMVQIPTNGLS